MTKKLYDAAYNQINMLFKESACHAVISHLCEDSDYTYPPCSDKVPQGQSS